MSNLISQRNAIRMLCDRIGVLRQYIAAVINSEHKE